ncbi:MAG: acyl-CoA desaturase [Chitinophagaceae bacterium]|nr:MAG: acyl-CoA desaturase [Chitinophagaceae bacterium]
MSRSQPQKKGSVKFVSTSKTLFFPELKKRVDQYFENHNIAKSGGFRIKLKTVVLLALYLVPFGFVLFGELHWAVSLVMWALMGLGMAGLGMSVMHDANHGAFSSKKSLNWAMSHILNLMGGSTVNWKLQHNILHHTYTNVDGMDDDISNKPALRLSPHAEAKPSHKFQWWHAFFLYSLTTLYWATAKDFMQWVTYRRNKVNTMTKVQYRWMLAKLIIVKSMYFFVLLVVPSVFFSVPFIQVITGFILMHALAGLILTVIFQLAHSLEGTSHPLPNDRGVIENEWAIHQMNTTANFSPRNKILSWYVGGLNYQVEHHLFPRISHVHYPAISAIVKSTANEFSIPYLQNDTFFKALGYHIQFLRKMGKMPDIDEAIG